MESDAWEEVITLHSGYYFGDHLPNNAEPLQTEEVVQALTKRQECTLIHQSTGTEVNIYIDQYDPKNPWCIQYSHSDILDASLLKEILALGFQLQAIVGTKHTHYQLYRNCHGIRAAAIKGLALARTLPGVPENAWLWATVSQYDDREEPAPEQPTPWPPEG